jgi:phytoene/squalene synthetase
VYVPQDALAAAGTRAEALAEPHASPALRACLAGLAQRTGALLAESQSFPAQIHDLRLALEVSVIQSYARRLVALLQARDPLSERVHLGKAGFAGYGILGVVKGLARRMTGIGTRAHKSQAA